MSIKNLQEAYSKRSSSLLKDLYQLGIKSISSSFAFAKIYGKVMGLKGRINKIPKPRFFRIWRNWELANSNSSQTQTPQRT